MTKHSYARELWSKYQRINRNNSAISVLSENKYISEEIAEGSRLPTVVARPKPGPRVPE